MTNSTIGILTALFCFYCAGAWSVINGHLTENTRKVSLGYRVVIISLILGVLVALEGIKL